jgi:hypothetical protein
MADSNTTGSSIVPAAQYEELRKKVTIKDSKNKTEKWLLGQIHERQSRLHGYLSQIANLEGMLEIAEDELKDLQGRLVKLTQIK